jgi:uncharacterized protein with GYD domain
MPKFLVRASYTAEGAKGILKAGASSRRSAVEQFMASMGGRLESFYYAYGEDDAIMIVDLPNGFDAAAASLAVKASGMIHTRTTVLVTPEELDGALHKELPFRPPGQ